MPSALATLGVLAALWWLLNPNDAASWVVGAPAVAIGAGLALLLPPAVPTRVSPAGALRFAACFARASVVGSLDVAVRALRPRMDLAPGFRTFETRLPPGPARALFANSITLLPGTLSADLVGARVTVHCLDVRADVTPELERLERRVGAVFGLALDRAEGSGS